MASESRLKTCFISAPLGSNTSVLRQALAAQGVSWSDQTSLGPSANLFDAIDKAVTNADFVCVVLPAENQGSIFFELGIAYARRKPILAFADPSANVPSEILSLTYVRSDATARDSVSYALSAFLKHAVEQPPTSDSPPQDKTTSRRVDTNLVPPGTGREFERLTAELLAQAGFIISGPSERRHQGADFAVWIEEFQTYSLGNPLLVEVKAGNVSLAGIHDAAVQLRGYVEKTHGRSGLLIYWDRENRNFPPVAKGWPLIFQMSGETLRRLVNENRLSQELVRLRNAAVHGEV